VQSGRDTARAEVASPALITICAQVRQASLLENDDVESPVETLGFLKKMDGEEGTGWSTADDCNAIVIPEAYRLKRGARHNPRL
jgi:hypothetical protein